MDVQVEISASQLKQLRQALSRTDVDDIASIIAKAGAMEALALATGDAVFSSISDLRSFRIYCLVSNGLELSDAELLVARIFKVPPATAKGMVRLAVARYSVALDDKVSASVKAALESATWVADDKKPRWEIQMPATWVRDAIIEELDGTGLPEPSQESRASVWRFPDETYQHVRKAFRLKPRAKP